MTKEDAYVAPEYHTEEADRFLLQEGRKILESSTLRLDVVSPERTSMIFNDAVASGFDADRARRLADHFDAGTEKINALPSEEATREYAHQVRIIRDLFAASLAKQEAQIQRFEAAKAILRDGKAPTL